MIFSVILRLFVGAVRAGDWTKLVTHTIVVLCTQLPNGEDPTLGCRILSSDGASDAPKCCCKGKIRQLRLG